MKKILLSLAASLIIVASFATSADAQRGRAGPGVGRVGGGGFVGVRGGGFRGGFVGAPGIRRAGFVGGPRWVGGRRWVGGPGWWGHRRFVHRRFFPGFVVGAAFVGAYPYYAGYGGCIRWRVVPTPWGPAWRRVNVCYPYAYGPYAYGAYPVGYW